MSTQLGALASLERNRFFYGKVMDVRQWRMEQAYGIQSRGLLARLGLGVGVLSGLDVELDGEAAAIVVRAGVAVDPLGRTIVVPNGVVLRHPTQPTDCRGAPDGDPVTDGALTLELCYHECLVEPVSAIACGCDTVERCEPGVVCERFLLRLTRGVPDPADPVACPVMFPEQPPADFDRRRAIWDTFGEDPVPTPVDPDGGGDCCVVLATLAVGNDGTVALDPFTYRRPIYSNQALFELLLCLAARVDACCGRHDEPLGPPRVTDVWPRDRQVLIDADREERDRWLKEPRIEIEFERPVEPAVLDRPEDWLRVWSFIREGDFLIARRVTLTHENGGPPPVLTQSASEQVATYVLDDRYRGEIREARLLVQLRPGTAGAPIVVDQSVPPLLLDGEHRGTALTPAQLDQLWSAVDAPTQVDPSMWDALWAAVPPAFPSGDGSPGGALDLSFTFVGDRPTEPGPARLMTIWPPNSVGLPDEARGRASWLRSFVRRPRLELSFDDTFDEANVAGVPVEDWIRLWWLPGEINAGQQDAVRVTLAYGGIIDPPVLGEAGRTIALVMEGLPSAEFLDGAPNRLLWVMRGDPIAVDSDFAGLILDRAPLDGAAIDTLWFNDQWIGGTVGGPASEGAELFDGQLGGIVTAFFDIARRFG